MKKNRRLVVANWKLNPPNLAKAKEIFSATRRNVRNLKRCRTVVCPPFSYLSSLKTAGVPQIKLGAQNVFWEDRGAFTGEVGAAMVRSVGAEYAIIGHSERRRLGETDEMASKKIAAALKAGLTPILCIGERERDPAGAYFEFLKNEIKQSLAKVQRSALKKIIIAYEPIWAIGKSFKDAMQPNDVHQTSLFIKKVLADLFGQEEAVTVPILYGGSVNFENAGAIVRDGEVEGLLVGRESLDPKAFGAILKIVDAI